MSCGTIGFSRLRGTRFFGQGSRWTFRTCVTGLSCPSNPLPQTACAIDFVPPAVSVYTTPATFDGFGIGEPIEIVLTKVVSGVQTGLGSCNVKVFREDASQVAGTVSYDPTMSTITFTPSEVFCVGTTTIEHLTVTIGSAPSTPNCPGIKDSCGNRLTLINLSIPVNCEVV